MVGSYFPFPRNLVLERYQERTTYLAKVRAASEKLVEGGYLLRRDLPSLEKIANREWDFVMHETVEAAH
jgi:hypothetical protein